MDETLRQLGELLLGAIPTVVLLVIINVCYRFLVHHPLQKVLVDRRERTEGASQKAKADIARAESKAMEYEQRLREARLQEFKAQESRRLQRMELRARMMAETRERADAQVKQALVVIGNEVAEAKIHLQSQIDGLADEVIARVLKTEAVAAGEGKKKS